MSIARFVPELWSTRLIRHLDKALVYGQPGVINRNYQGEIANQGDTVHISQIHDLTVNTYTKGDPISYENADSDKEAELAIDQAKYFAVEVEDIDQVQANVELVDSSVQRGAYRLADEVDQFIAAFADEVGNTVPENALGFYESLIDASVKLDEQNVPSDGRFAVIPPWAHGLLLTDLRFAGSGAAAADTRLLNGFVGEAAGFSLMKSNNVPVDGDTYEVLAGSNQGITLATQLTETEAMRSPDNFSDRVRSLLVYGGTVVNEDELVVLSVDRPTGS